MIIWFIIILLLWGAIDYVLAARKRYWVWGIAPIAFLLIIVLGVLPLMEPAMFMVIDRFHVPVGGVQLNPIAWFLAALGMVLNALDWWIKAGGAIWRKFG